jgi:peroxiredoxin
LFVSVDEPDTREAARIFAAEHGLHGQLLVAARPLGSFKRAMNPEWPGMLPATFLFDGTTKLRYFWGGPVFEDELMPIVEGFLAGKPIDGQSTPGLSPGLDLRD